MSTGTEARTPPPTHLHAAHRLIRALAYVELARSLSIITARTPGPHDSTDDADRLFALLDALRVELEAVYQEASHA